MVVKKKLKGEVGFNRVLHNYKNGARQRNLEFNLSKEDFKELVTKNCYYCGTPPANRIGGRSEYSTFTYSGIDRKNNSKAYSKENCVSCCKHCNMMKRAYSEEEFVDQCHRIVQHLQSCKDLASYTI